MAEPHQQNESWLGFRKVFWGRPQRSPTHSFTGCGQEMETAAFLVGNQPAEPGMIMPMKVVFVALAIGLASGLPSVGEENSAQRLESIQKGMAEASWPRKPDNRLSPLSGKMKDSQEISVRYYGKEKEFRGRSAEGWLKEASFGQKANWEGASGRKWEEERLIVS